MIGSETIRYTINNMMIRKTRSFLTILSIFVGIATIFIFASFGLGLFNYMNEVISSSSVDKVIIQARSGGAPGLDSQFQLNDDDLDVILKTKGVIDASGISFKVAEVKQDKRLKYTFLLAFDPEKPLMLDISNIEVVEGRMLREGDKGKVLLGYNYMIDEKIFPRGYKINQKINIEGKDVEIVGFFNQIGNPQDDSQIYVTTEYLDDLYAGDENFYGWIIAKVNTNEMERIIDDIEKRLRNHRNLEKGKEDFFVQSFDDLLKSYSLALYLIVGFVLLIALISVIVSIVNTANTMVTSVLERTKEIGVMKAIGAKNSEVFKVFLLESLILGFIAGVIGVLIGGLFSFFAGVLLKALGWGFLQPYYPWYLFLGCVAFATLTGAVSGAIPALWAAKTKPVDTLRYE